MLAALMESIAFVASIASLSLVCGLLRAAKVYSQATEDHEPSSAATDAPDEQSGSAKSQTLTGLRNVS